MRIPVSDGAKRGATKQRTHGKGVTQLAHRLATYGGVRLTFLCVCSCWEVMFDSP